jgi:PAS domain S-box-containing protein
MKPREERDKALESLRHKAERHTPAPDSDLSQLAPEDVRRLLYELQVHHVELKMQNQELLETQGRLAASEQRYYQLFDLAPVGFLSLDLQGRIQELNQAAAELLTRSDRDVLGTPFFLFVEPGSRDIYNAHIRNISESLCRDTCELTLTSQENSGKRVRLESRPVQEGNILTGLMSAVIDISKRQEAFDRLEEANRLLDRKTTELRELSRELIRTEHRERERLAQVLHDHLQQLLVAAKLNLRSLGSPRQQQVVREVDKLLDQSITLSRSLVSDLVPPVVFHQETDETLRWLARQLKETYGLEVQIHAPEAIEAPNREERILLLEIIRELLINVAKHAEASSANVTVVRDEPAGIRALVTDEGVGFDPETQFAHSQSGFGLLSIKHRLSWIGGELKIDSAPGEGCRIEVRFPFQAEERVSEKTAAAMGKAPEETTYRRRRTSSGRIRVLIVDDHKILRQGLSSIISREPDLDLVGEAKDGVEAITLTRQLDPDVVIMDIEMPGFNGIEATRAILAERPAVRVVGLSMHTREDMEESMRAAGASEYLPKDGPAENLLAAIRGRR